MRPYARHFIGTVVGICIAANAARSAGSITVQARINGAGVTGLTAVLDATNTTYKGSTIAKDASGGTFASGDRVDAIITTSSDWAPTTDDVVITVIGEF